MENLTIAKAARAAGVGVETIRFYERRGLVAQPKKPRGSGFRLYSLETVDRIKFIRQAQEIGFSLHEIQELLSLRANPAADCSAVRGQAVTKLKEVQRKIDQLHRIENALEALIAVCPGRGAIEACTILDALADPARAAVPPNGSGQQAPMGMVKDNGADDRPPAGKRAQGRWKEPYMKSLTLNIEGMNCDACAEAISALLHRQTGVKTADVTFEQGKARILYDPTAIDEGRLVATIERPGYRVTGRAA